MEANAKIAATAPCQQLHDGVANQIVDRPCITFPLETPSFKRTWLDKHYGFERVEALRDKLAILGIDGGEMVALQLVDVDAGDAFDEDDLVTGDNAGHSFFAKLATSMTQTIVTNASTAAIRHN